MNIIKSIFSHKDKDHKEDHKKEIHEPKELKKEIESTVDTDEEWQTLELKGG